MPIPTSGSFTDANCRTEWSLGLPMTSGQLGAATGLGSAFTSETLRGMSVLTAAINQASLSGSALSFGGSTTAYTQFATLTISGGTGTTTYQWYVNGGAGITAPTGATTRLALSGGPGSSISGYVWCVVTRGGVSVTTPQVPYELSILSEEA